MTHTSTNNGIVYRLTLPNGPFEILHSFGPADPANGLAPIGALVQAPDGYLYGVCSGGGNEYSQGTLFRIGLDGSFATMYLFAEQDALGGPPRGGMVLHPNGFLYGMTNYSVNRFGTLYQFDPTNGTIQILAPGVGYDVGGVPAVGQDGGLHIIGTLQILRYGVDGSVPLLTLTLGRHFSRTAR